MPTTSLLSDEILRQLIAVGHVDLAVGVPTLNHADVVEDIVEAVYACFRGHFPRARAALVNVDGGSEDGTPERVLEVPRDGRSSGGGGLRTIQRVSARYPGLVSRTRSVQVLFAANELVQARAMAFIDPDCSVSPESIAGLIRPVLEEPCDFVMPLYRRAWHEGALVTQLLRPFVSGLYGRRLAEPAAGEWACSAQFASDRLGGELWEENLGPAGVSLWMATSALAGDYVTRQVGLGSRPAPLRSLHATLPEMFTQMAGTLYRCLALHSAYWRATRSMEEVPMIGEATGSPGEMAAPDPGPVAESFRVGARDLEPLLTQILEPDTWLAVRQLAESGDDDFEFADALWVRVVYEFAAAYHHNVMHRDHLAQALVTPYLGRTASFLKRHGSGGAADVSDGLASLELEFERAKPYLIERWNPGGTP